MISYLLNIILILTGAGSQDSAIQSYLETQLSEFEKVSFNYVSDQSKYKELRINTNAAANIMGNLVHIPVTYLRNGSRRSGKFTVRVKAYKYILVSKANIKRGELLSSEQFEKKLTNCITLDEPIVALYDYTNHRTASYIKKGEPLLLKSIEPMPVVMPGDKLTAHSVAGNVDIQVSAVARQEGGIDDIIRVKTHDNKLYKVRVIDNSNVLIIE